MYLLEYVNEKFFEEWSLCRADFALMDIPNIYINALGLSYLYHHQVIILQHKLPSLISF